MLSSSIFSFWVLFIFFNSLPPSLSLPFSPSTTTNNNNLTLFGDAHFINNSISLTQELNCLSPPSPPSSSSSSSSSSGVGRAFYVFPIRFLDSSTNSTLSFSSRFSFRLSPSSSLCPFGDGFAFLITSKSYYVSLSDGYMGLPNQSFHGQDSFVAVEFDTSFDSSLGDINDNHVGIDVNSVVSLASIDAFSKGIDLKSGRQMTAWVEYRDMEKTIRVFVGYSQNKPLIPLLVAQIDLSMQFKEFMHVGFSASNLRGSATHLVDSWRFKTYGSPSSMTPMDIVEEGDCFLCSLGNSGDENGHMNKRVGELVLVLGGLVAFVISVSTVVVIVIVCLIRRRRRVNRRGCNEGRVCRFQGNRIPKRLSLSAIKSATKGFNQKRIIGEGGSAIVYEGYLPSCGLVAVKRFSQVNQIGSFHSHFTTEFETMVGCLQHEHLVQLQGWCCEGNELVLVYEYMANGSLDKILHKSNNALTVFLTWDRRLSIVLGVASALIYLHEECERQIIHRDVKTCNIMLNDEFNAKLGDFGLAEVYEHSSITREATIPAGTMGYLAPEYVYLGVPTVKTDVYSFGVVVLEVASGKKPVDDYGTVLVYWVWDLWEKGILIKAADSKLRGRFNRLEMERMLMVGLSCVHPNYEKRPTMKEAARMIRGEALLPILPARKPMVRIRPIQAEGSEEIMNFGGDDNANLDDTPWLTPKTHF